MIHILSSPPTVTVNGKPDQRLCQSLENLAADEDEMRADREGRVAMKYDHDGWQVKVYRQAHRDYPPWVATAAFHMNGKCRFVNVEGQTAEDAERKILERIEAERKRIQEIR